MLKSIVGEANIFTTNEKLEKYASDETEDLVYLPEVAVCPQTVEQISQIAKLCNNNRIPLTTRGAGTGLSGGALPVMVRMQKRAPLWMQQSGLEWMFRFIQEPRRLFKRYAVTNTRFVMLLLKELIQRQSLKLARA